LTCGSIPWLKRKKLGLCLERPEALKIMKESEYFVGGDLKKLGLSLESPEALKVFKETEFFITLGLPLESPEALKIMKESEFFITRGLSRNLRQISSGKNVFYLGCRL
jgi:hypothetical protein